MRSYCDRVAPTMTLIAALSLMVLAVVLELKKPHTANTGTITGTFEIFELPNVPHQLQVAVNANRFPPSENQRWP